MKKYNGAIVDHEGYTVFEFTTKFCNNYNEAAAQATLILEAWRLYTGRDSFKWALEKD